MPILILTQARGQNFNHGNTEGTEKFKNLPCDSVWFRGSYQE
jgi:hypothetical protein